MNTIRMFTHVALIFSFLLLAISGFVPAVFWGRSPSGYLLFAHILLTPLYGISVVLLLLVAYQPFVGWITKTAYGFLCFFSIPLILSAATSMFPLFETSLMEGLLLCHVANAIATAVALILFYFSYSLDLQANL